MLSGVGNIIFAALIGAVAAVLGIVFIEGVGAVGALLNREESYWLWVVASPVAAGCICALIGAYLPRHIFLGLADMYILTQRRLVATVWHNILSVLAAFTALGGGASVGQYGPIAHLGGFFGNLGGKYLPPGLGAACGIAAAIAAAFNAPITGLLFAHEVILRHYSLRAFTPVAVSAVVGYSISAGLFERPPFLHIADMAGLHPSSVALFGLLGVLFGGLAYCYLRAIFWLNVNMNSVPLYYRLPLAGLATGLLALWIPSISGGDKPLLEATIGGIDGEPVLAILFAKAVATILCLGVGFAGGVVSPTLVIGALSGLLFYQAGVDIIALMPVPVPVSAVVLCGMMALTAPVIGAPLTAILFVMELSGSYPIAIAATVAIAIAVQTTAKLGGRSYYDNQLMGRGIDTRLRRDEFLLQTTTIADLGFGAAVQVRPSVTVQAAVEKAVQMQVSQLYISGDNEDYIGFVRLPALLQAAAANGDAPVERFVDKEIPRLLATDTLSQAMHKLENFIGDSAPVLDDGRLLGVISESDLLRAYNRLVSDHREEETAV